MVHRDQVLSFDQLSGPGQLHRCPGHPPRALHAQGLGGQLQLEPGLSKGIITQLGPVSNDNFPFLDFFQLLPQLLQGDGTVGGQPLQLFPAGLEQGVIHLLAPGVHGAHDDRVLIKGQGPGHGLQGGAGRAVLVRPPR